MKKSIAIAAAGVLIAGSTMLAAASPAHAADRTCRSTISNAIVYGNVVVPVGASCTLNNVQVRGNVELKRNASLTTYGGRYTGNVIGESTPRIITLNNTRVDGNVQTKNAYSRISIYGGFVLGDVQAERNASELRIASGARVYGDVQTKYTQLNLVDSRVDGNVQHEEGRAGRIVRNRVGGDVQVFKNSGTQQISTNTIRGNLQCKENVPAPIGGGNIVSGSKEDQCRTL